MHHLIDPERLTQYPAIMREVVRFIERNDLREFSRQDVSTGVGASPGLVSRHLNELVKQGRLREEGRHQFSVVGDRTITEEDVVAGVTSWWSEQGSGLCSWNLLHSQSALPSPIFSEALRILEETGRIRVVHDPYGQPCYASLEKYEELDRERREEREQALASMSPEDRTANLLLWAAKPTEAILGLFWPHGVPVADLDTAQNARREFTRVVAQLGLELPLT